MSRSGEISVSVVTVTDLPPSATDSGYRQGDDELWIDSSNPEVIYRVSGDTADVFIRDDSLGCA